MALTKDRVLKHDLRVQGFHQEELSKPNVVGGRQSDRGQGHVAQIAQCSFMETRVCTQWVSRQILA